MQLLIVHGMGRTPLSMWPLARYLRRCGHEVTTVGYIAALQRFETICSRVRAGIDRLSAGAAPYAVLGHSLGGLILRMALAAPPALARPPARLIMLGTPNQPSRLARRFRGLLPYRLFNGHAGQLLADQDFFDRLPPPRVPYTIIAGVAGRRGGGSFFRDEPNDGVVAVSETVITSHDAPFLVPARHTFMMNHPEVRQAVRRLLDPSSPGAGPP